MTLIISDYCKICKYCSNHRIFATEIQLLSQHVFSYILKKHRKTLTQSVQESVDEKYFKDKSQHFTKNIGNAVWVSVFFLKEYIDAFYQHPYNRKLFEIFIKRLWLNWMDYRKNVFVKVIDFLAIVIGAWMIYIEEKNCEYLEMREIMEWFVDVFHEKLATEFFNKGSWEMLKKISKEWYSDLFSNLKNLICLISYKDCKLVGYVRESPVYFPVPKTKICGKCQRGSDQNFYRKVIYMQPEHEYYEESKTMLDYLKDWNVSDSKEECLTINGSTSFCNSLSGTKIFDRGSSSKKRVHKKKPVDLCLIASLTDEAQNEEISFCSSLNNYNPMNQSKYANNYAINCHTETQYLKNPPIIECSDIHMAMQLEEDELNTESASKITVSESLTPIEQNNKLPVENLTDYSGPGNSSIHDPISRISVLYVQELKDSISLEGEFQSIKERDQTELHLASETYSNSFQELVQQAYLDYAKCNSAHNFSDFEMNLKLFMRSKSNPPNQSQEHTNIQSIQDVSRYPIYLISFKRNSYEFYFLGNPKKATSGISSLKLPSKNSKDRKLR